MEFDTIIKSAESKKSKSQSKVTVFLVSILLLVLVLSGYYLLYNFFKKDKTPDWSETAERLTKEINTASKNLSIIKVFDNNEIDEFITESTSILDTAVTYYSPILTTEEVVEDFNNTEIIYQNYTVKNKSKKFSIKTMNEDIAELENLNFKINEQLSILTKREKDVELNKSIENTEDLLIQAERNLSNIKLDLNEITSLQENYEIGEVDVDNTIEFIANTELKIKDIREQFDNQPNFNLLNTEAESILELTKQKYEEINKDLEDLKKRAEELEEERKLEEEARIREIEESFSSTNEDEYEEVFNGKYKDELDELYNWDNRVKDDE